MDLLDDLRMGVDQHAGTGIALQREHLVPDLAREQRRPRAVAEHEPNHGRASEGVHPRQCQNVFGGDPRLVGHENYRGIARVVQCVDAAGERGGLALRVALVDDDAGRLGKRYRGPHAIGVVTEYHDDLADPGLLVGVCAPQVPCGAYAREAFELAGVDEELAREALRLAAQKLPLKVKFVRREADLFES